MSDKIIYENKGVVQLPNEPADINEVANVIIKCREFSSFARSCLSNEGVSSLLRASFYLSMRSDEGRFPHLRIVSGEENDARLVVRFKPALPFEDVHELRRISPIAEGKDFAILVSEQKDGTLICPGLINIGHGGNSSIPGRPEIVPSGGPFAVKVFIEGPGHLYISESSVGIEYRAGRVRLVTPVLFYIPRLQKLTKDISGPLHRRSMDLVPDIQGAEEYFGGRAGLESIVRYSLESMLYSCLEMRHGGAFVVLPEVESEPEKYDISCKYQLDGPHFGEDISEYWAVNVEATYAKKDGVEEYDRMLRKTYNRKATFLNNIDAIAQLSAADGCVVFSGALRVLGFGGSILVSEENCLESDVKVKISRTEICTVETFLASVGGQRHQSAARLAIMYPEVIVFVISQDGELTVFGKDSEDCVRAYKPVDPSLIH